MAKTLKTSDSWEPPASLSKEELVKISDGILAEPDIPYTETEDVFRIHANGMDWDIGCMVYEPTDPAKIPTGPDGNKLGIFMIHGGASDWRSIERLAQTFAGKRGYKVCNMTYPGRLYLPDPSRDWPGDTFHEDGGVRTPIWLDGEFIGRDEYEVVDDAAMREIYGSRKYARAKRGSNFYYRMAAWPVAFEEGMLDICRRHLPVGEYSVFTHGHSTGGPFSHYLLQRIENGKGLIGIENSPFAFIFRKMSGHDWPTPFDHVLIRNWRELARYKGAEVAMQEGAEPLFRLAWLMEEIFDMWEQAKRFPQFKAENWLHSDSHPCLTEAAKVTAERLKMNAEETQALVDRYLSYGRPLPGPDAKPIPPLLYGINKFSRDHTPEKYNQIVKTEYAAMDPAPKVRVVEIGTGIHSYWKTEEGLPLGVCPVITKVWHDAVMNGYYEV